MNTYKAKQAAKEALYAKWADQLEAKAERLVAYDREQMAVFPGGQPILTDHPQEKKYRAAIKRSHQRANKIKALLKKAKYYRQKSAIQRPIISAKDAEAIPKLQIKLLGLERWRAEMQRINQEYHHKGRTAIDDLPEKIKWAALKYLCLSQDKPFPSFILTDNQTEIRRTKKRIVMLQKRLDSPAKEPIRGDGFILTENQENNRIEFEFEEKPNRAVCHLLRTQGFRFSYRRGLWMRQLTKVGQRNAQLVLEKLVALLGDNKKG